MMTKDSNLDDECFFVKLIAIVYIYAILFKMINALNNLYVIIVMHTYFSKNFNNVLPTDCVCTNIYFDIFNL